jgi:predicted anti-sigma-YlaC factor YlaD
MPHRYVNILILAVVLSLGSGCSVRMIAVDTLGDMLASGDSVFTEDDDIELIGGALPFSLKLVESLLAESPDHRGLLLAAARGYVLYSYAYVHFAAEQAAAEDIREARRLRIRAQKFYLRGFDFAVRGLELNYPHIGQALLRTPERALSRLNDVAVIDVPFLYWGASALGLAISVSKNDPAMLARLPEVEAMLQRSLVLDEAYDHGALHEFALVWFGVASRAPDRAVIDRHYQRALELSAGQRASLYVAYAIVTALPSQERQQFHSLMQEALAVDPDALPGARLLNAIAQRRAGWLLSRSSELFLE